MEWFTTKSRNSPATQGCATSEAVEPHRPVCILFVEPDSTLRSVLGKWLREVMPECTVLEAGTYQQAAVVAERTSPHVVVVDIAQPDVDGKEIVQGIRRAALPAAVVALTMYDHKAYCQELEAAGANDCMLIWEMRAKLPTRIARLVAGEGSQPGQAIPERAMTWQNALQGRPA